MIEGISHKAVHVSLDYSDAFGRTTARAVVGALDSGGILNFAEGGIRDETGKGEGGSS